MVEGVSPGDIGIAAVIAVGALLIGAVVGFVVGVGIRVLVIATKSGAGTVEGTGPGKGRG